MQTFKVTLMIQDTATPHYDSQSLGRGIVEEINKQCVGLEIKQCNVSLVMAESEFTGEE